MSAATKENAAVVRGVLSATGQKHKADVNSEKHVATIRAKLCIAGGQTLYSADDGSFFVTSPWGQIQRFADIHELQSHVDKVCA